MLPMATPPNAIVFGSGKITVGEMFLAGLVMNVPALAVTLVLTQWLIPRVFGV
jgi:sodium-dependent dicarboxylate transporter 2/3/5